MTEVPVAYAWRTNAALLTDAVFPVLRAAGLWSDDMTALDPTYGDGKWWTEYRPANLTTRSRRDDPGWDYRSMPWADDTFSLVAYDPPYVCKGGRDTSTIEKMNDAYGLDDAPLTPEGLLKMNHAGLAECLRVANRCVLLKSMSFVSGGVLHCHTDALVAGAERGGWAVYEQFVHLPTGGRPQPPGRRQLRGRRRPSTLTVLVPRRLRRGERVWRCGRCRARFTVHPQITTAEARAAHLAVGCRKSHPAAGGGK